MRLSLYLLVLLTFFFVCETASARSPTQTVKGEKIRFYRGTPYNIELLQLALDKTQAEYGKALVFNETDELARSSTLALSHGYIDVITTPRYRATKGKHLLPIEVPIQQGMLGFRLLYTTEHSEAKLAQAQTIEDFRKRLIGGVGLYWQDFQIYLHNQLLMKTSARREQLFEMLAQGEVDYFGRGVSEIFYEYEVLLNADPNIKSSTEIALYYHLPVYFYVAQSDTELAKRIELGLTKAERDGSFQKLFLKHFATTIGQLKEIAPNKLICLETPDLTLEKGIHFDWWLEGELLKSIRQAAPKQQQE